MISSIFPVARKNINRNRQTPQTKTMLQTTLEKLWGFLAVGWSALHQVYCCLMATFFLRREKEFWHRS